MEVWCGVFKEHGWSSLCSRLMCNSLPTLQIWGSICHPWFISLHTCRVTLWRVLGGRSPPVPTEARGARQPGAHVCHYYSIASNCRQVSFFKETKQVDFFVSVFWPIIPASQQLPHDWPMCRQAEPVVAAQSWPYPLHETLLLRGWEKILCSFRNKYADSTFLFVALSRSGHWETLLPCSPCTLSCFCIYLSLSVSWASCW